MSALTIRSGKRGVELLHDPRLNKSTGFTEAERQTLGLVGLVPDATESIEARSCLAAAQEQTQRPRTIHSPDEFAGT